MLIAGTKENRRLAGLVNARVSADARLVNAKAWAIWFCAIGAMALMIGAGVYVAFLGVARSRDASGAADRLADTLTRALERSKLHAEIDPASTVRLDPAAQVAIDPHATVRLDEAPALPRPGRDQLKPDAVPSSKHAVETNYTVFKMVRWGQGQVVTGYTFAPDGRAPEHQYCYFADGIDKQTYKTLHIAAEGRYTPPEAPPGGIDTKGIDTKGIDTKGIDTKGVDTRAAAAECVWFDGRPTRF